MPRLRASPIIYLWLAVVDETGAAPEVRGKMPYRAAVKGCQLASGIPPRFGAEIRARQVRVADCQELERKPRFSARTPVNSGVC